MPIDYSEYPPNWHTEIRPAVLKRANNRCEDCGLYNHSIICKDDRKRPSKQQWDMYWDLLKRTTKLRAMRAMQFTKIILTIAHLDHDKLNHDVKLDRLKALCQKCHLGLDIEHHKTNRKYGRNWKRDQLSLDFNENPPPTPPFSKNKIGKA